ncbi:MAG: zinc metalloprotease HtpX [Ponticaulis sp.]|nr:zinc metalloprotease HtpX [Ponticaulis sp.]|tara:strand:+ start:51171 stop:52106 length:936 start_codon:yes stop_codon:yes gene_type:complete
MLNHTKTFILLAAMTALFGGVGYLVGGVPGMAIAFVIAVGLNVFSYWNSDSIVLKSYKARPAADYKGNRKVSDYLEDTRRLAANAGLPEPKIYIIEMDQPNAFATGRNPDNAAVVATTGLLNMLERDEIAGVMAHELAHVKNRDTLTMTVTATIAGAIGLLANFALFFGGGRERGGLIAALAIAFLAPIAASIVQMAISRAREYEADKAGAEILGDPEPLARALAKISGKAELMPDRTVESHQATAHMFIVNPLAGQKGDNLFSTHPATQNRIEALMALKGQASPPPAASRGPQVSPWLKARQDRKRGPWG